MKHKVILFSAIILIGVCSFSILSRTGKAGYTGSPGENSCNHCHSTYPLNSGPGSLKIRTNIPNDLYEPDSIYEISVVVEQSGRSLFGFGFEALMAGNVDAGTFIVTDAVRTHQLNAGNGRKNMTHKLNGGASADSSVFTFNWQAPSTNVGAITFYYTGVAANGNNENNLDYVYRDSHTISSLSTVSIEETNLISNINLIVGPNEIVGTYDLSTPTKLTVELVSLQGKVVQQIYLGSAVQGNNQFRIATDYLNTGIYILNIRSNTTRLSKKFFIP